jgi:putative peptidoglycan lipid II flippase
LSVSRRLLKSAATVSVMTLISRILGFARDVIIARVFGAGTGADAFFVAFRIPNLLRRLFAEGAFSQAFVPVFAEYRTQRDHAAVRELADHTAGALGTALLLVSTVGMLAAPVIVMVFAPGFTRNAEKYALTVEMLRINFPYLTFISLTALAGGMLNSYGRFGVPAFTPVFLNLSLIAAALWLAPHLETPIVALAWGVFIGGLVQLLFQLPFLHRLKLLPRPRLKRRHEGVGRVLRLMVPALFGVSVAQINLMIDTLIASFLVSGSVSWLYYSDRLMEFPLGVFGIALGTVVLPSLSRHHASASVQDFSRTLDWALRWVVLIGTPATVGLVVLAGPILTTLFQYGEFSAHDAEMSTRSLMAYAFGLLGFILIKVLAPGFYARQDTRTPVRIGVIAMIANIGFILALVLPLAHAGLALATSLSGYINAGLLYRGLRRQGVYHSQAGWGPLALRVTFANALMAAVLWLGAGALAEWLPMSGPDRALNLALWIAAGGVTYLLALWLSGMRLHQLQTEPAASR